MKIDMHCHTKEGSIDGKVPIEMYITLLKEQGFGGMVVTDHDSYNGYRYWRDNIKGKTHTDFKVFKGIEYDTSGAGHVIIILPEGVKLKLMELRGLPLNILVSAVHSVGGILGPAHPGGDKYLALMKTRAYRKDPRIVKRFDFIETFNSCETDESNELAARLAAKYDKPGTGGSDAHKPDCVGLGYTEVPDDVCTESELIACIKNHQVTGCGGTRFQNTAKGKMGHFHGAMLFGFFFYNKAVNLVRMHKRNSKLKSEYVDQETKL